MKESTQQLMLNAEETLHAAEMLFREEYLRDAVNRAYYAVFYSRGLVKRKRPALQKARISTWIVLPALCENWNL